MGDDVLKLRDDKVAPFWPAINNREAGSVYSIERTK